MTDSSDRTDRDDVNRMNEYRELQEVSRLLRENALEADDLVDECKWIAAGGRGGAPLQELKKRVEAMRKNAETLEEVLEEVPDPREVRDDAE